MLPYKIYTRKKIFNYYTGLSFFIFIWITREPHDQTSLIRHEKIHFWQQVEMLFIFHWLFYAFFYLVGRMNGQCHYIAYRYNPFEIEAFSNDRDEKYLQKRRPFAWASFVKEFFASLRKDHSRNIPEGKKIIWYRSQRG
jgi:hypothetical protein